VQRRSLHPFFFVWGKVNQKKVEVFERRKMGRRWRICGIVITPAAQADAACGSCYDNMRFTGGAVGGGVVRRQCE